MAVHRAGPLSLSPTRVASCPDRLMEGLLLKSCSRQPSPDTRSQGVQRSSIPRCAERRLVFLIFPLFPSFFPSVSCSSLCTPKSCKGLCGTAKEKGGWTVDRSTGLAHGTIKSRSRAPGRAVRALGMGSFWTCAGVGGYPHRWEVVLRTLDSAGVSVCVCG